MAFGKKKKNNIDVLTLSEMVEFTLLDPRALKKDIHTLINVAVKNNYYAVCVNPVYVADAREYIDKTLNVDLGVVSVVGFPLGASTIKTKICEVKQALKDGADEIDYVLNISKVKENDFLYIKKEMQNIVKAAKHMIVKVIIETCYLTKEEIKQVCKICEKIKIDFIKTSTGYGTQGATVEDVMFIKDCVKGKIGIKASGGVRTREQAEELVRAGANRIGSSRTIWWKNIYQIQLKILLI